MIVRSTITIADLLQTWKDWKEGGECVKEQTATHEILGILTPEEHRAVVGGGTWRAECGLEIDDLNTTC